jgi:hypothetical protein
LELLAAVVILSAVAAAFASVARDASVALRASTATEEDAEARLALRLWETAHENLALELAELAQAADERGVAVERSWRFTLNERSHWRAAALATPSQRSSLAVAQADHAWTQPAALVALRVWRDGEDPSDALVTTRLVPLPPAPPASPTAAVRLLPSRRSGGAS